MSEQKYAHKINEYVVYRKHGVYIISDIRREKLCGSVNTYYILRSVYDASSVVYVPVDSDDLVEQMDRVLSRDEVNTIIDSSEQTVCEWVPNTAERARVLEEIMGSGDLSRILGMLKVLMLRKKENSGKNSKTFAHDERMLSAAQRAVTEAFAFPLGLEKAEVIPYIIDRVSA